MDKVLGVPLNTNNWLVFSVWNDSSLPYTDGTNAEFEMDILIDGVDIDPVANGFEVYHMSKGRYHVTNSGDPDIPYISTVEEQVYLRVWHDTYGSYTLFEFWAGTESSDPTFATDADITKLLVFILGLY